jgi:glutathione S-transferase
MLLYDSQVSGNCYKVRLLLSKLGLSYERHEVDVIDHTGRAGLLGDLNPALRVPTLVLDDGRALAESNAILWYLADGTDYLPDEGALSRSWARTQPEASARQPYRGRQTDNTSAAKASPIRTRCPLLIGRAFRATQARMPANSSDATPDGQVCRGLEPESLV